MVPQVEPRSAADGSGRVISSLEGRFPSLAAGLRIARARGRGVERAVAATERPAGALMAWAGRLGLVVLPLVLSAWTYGVPDPSGRVHRDFADNDAAFHVYQLGRMGEVRGRWWRIGDDPLVGRPYPSSAERHPGLYEGLDLLLPAAITARVLDPATNYRALMALTLAINGWIAAWLTLRVTRSFRWAALAVVLITLNSPTAAQISLGHIHLLKTGWTVLAAWASSRFLVDPSPRRGVVLALASVAVLQGTFYYAFFLALGLGLIGLGRLIAGRLDRRHAVAGAVAAAAAIPLAAVATFPVWGIGWGKARQSGFFRRGLDEVWMYGSQPAQYFLPLGNEQISLIGTLRPGAYEGWNYPGRVVLLALGLELVRRLRGGRPPVADPRLLDHLLALSGLLVVLSLSGGPALLIYPWITGFRAYGRAGFLAVGLWSVTTPMILRAFVTRLPGATLRAAAFAGAMALALIDGAAAGRWLDPHGVPGPPPWVAWLAAQPPEVRMAAFPMVHDEARLVDTGHWSTLPFRHYQADHEIWTWASLYYRMLHRHAALDGAQLPPMQEDLRRYGASYERMSVAGLRHIASLGYNAMAFERAYLEANPWIVAIPWLEPTHRSGDWTIYRVRSARRP